MSAYEILECVTRFSYLFTGIAREMDWTALSAVSSMHGHALVAYALVSLAGDVAAMLRKRSNGKIIKR